MSNVVEIQKNNVVLFNNEQLDLLKKTIAKGATDDELNLFVNQCKRTGLDPFTRQIYFIKDKNNKVTIVTSIDGLRLVAERSGKYEGQTEPQWCGEDGIWKDIWLSSAPPAAAKIGVWKSGFKQPTYAVAIFKEYAGYSYGKLSFMWDKMPATMIAKVAESLALRKVFPNDLSGLYTTEEVAQTIDAIEVRENTEIKPVAEQIAAANDPYIFVGGELSGKHFSEVDKEKFISLLTKYEEVIEKKPALSKLIANMTRYLSESEKLAMDDFDKKAGLK